MSEEQKVAASIHAATWNVTGATIRFLAAELIRAAECMGEDDDELTIEVRRPGTVADDDGKTNEQPILAISLAEYPEEGAYPIDPTDPTGGRVDATPAPGVSPEPFQARVQPWMMACFGAEIAADQKERNHRFIEEALELVQACGATQSEAHQLVDYVYGRPVGEKAQEVGGVMVTLAALCLAQGLDMHAAGETELARIWTKVEQIRAKQAAKPKHSPLPELVRATSPADQAGWQPIETAPRDGRPLLLFARSLRAQAPIRLVGWLIYGRGWVEVAFAPNHPTGVEPSHWMPLPGFPVKEKA